MSDDYKRPEWLKPLARISDSKRYLKGDEKTRVLHIRAVVDEVQVVYRYWWGARWVYEIRSPYFFWYAEQEGTMKYIGMDKE